MKNGIVDRFTPVVNFSDFGFESPGVEKVKDGEYVSYEDYLHERETVKKLKRLLAKKKRREMRKGLAAKENSINYRETW